MVHVKDWSRPVADWSFDLETVSLNHNQRISNLPKLATLVQLQLGVVQSSCWFFTGCTTRPSNTTYYSEKLCKSFHTSLVPYRTGSSALPRSQWMRQMRSQTELKAGKGLKEVFVTSPMEMVGGKEVPNGTAMPDETRE